jgi:cell envelope opacity-associated protein A
VYERVPSEPASARELTLATGLLVTYDGECLSPPQGETMAQSNDRFEQLKQKYQPVLNLIEQQGLVQLQNINMQGDKLFIRGVAQSEQAKNKVWDQIKLVDPNHSDLIADITVSETARDRTQAAGAAMGGGQQQTYTVQPGDTLSKISKQFYRDANQYMRIFEANHDKIDDPNKIQPGQQLVIPS